MHIINFFDVSITPANKLVALYDFFSFRSKSPRVEWKTKVFNGAIVNWRQSKGIWRSVNPSETIQIVGAGQKNEFQENLASWRPMLLQYALVMMLSAVDKVLHQATTTKKFVKLLKTGELDNLIKSFPPSEIYSIAMKSRKRSGRGGRILVRPANLIKAIISDKLYEIPFLKAHRLAEICAANGVVNIFAMYAPYSGLSSAEELKSKWASLCDQRNKIVHECNIVRTKISSKKIRFNAIDPVSIRRDIVFVEKFGRFIAQKLS